jgi:Fe-S oxidoreductase
MLGEKLRRLAAVDVDAVVTSDGGCMLHLHGGMARQGITGKPMRHLAQVVRGRRP